MIIKDLPLAQRTEAAKWELFNAYSLRTIRDTFLYVATSEGLSRADLFKAMCSGEIAPPGKKWTGIVAKGKSNRIEIEYLQACKYLKLVDETSNKLIIDRDGLQQEKELICQVNEKKRSANGSGSPPFLKDEIEAWLKITQNYVPACEYLWWFMNFSEFPTPESVTISEFTAKGDMIYLSVNSGSKAPEKIFRLIDGENWKIPFNDVAKNGKIVRANDYTRLMDKLFPSWYEDLGVVEKIKILDEFKFQPGNWMLHFPIRVKALNANEVEKFIQDTFNQKKTHHCKIFVPLLVYEIAVKFRAPVEVIKQTIIDIYKQNSGKYLLERSSLQVMKYANNIRQHHEFYRKLFIRHRDFYRNYLTIIN